MELWPNFKFLSPSAVSEHRDPTLSIGKREIRSLDGSKICHFIGKIKGIYNSRVAISTCNGLVTKITPLLPYYIYGNPIGRSYFH